MALKDTKLDSNGVQIANCFQKKKKTIIARQIGAPPPDPVCDVHELNRFVWHGAPIATFLGITRSLDSSSLQPLEQNHSCAPAVYTRNCIFILFTKLKIWFPKTNSLRIVALQEGRGWRPAPSVTILGWHHLFFFFCFLLRPKTHWLVGKNLFLLVITYFQTESQLVLKRRPFFYFLFGLHLFFGQYRVPPRNPAPCATIISYAYS